MPRGRWIALAGTLALALSLWDGVGPHGSAQQAKEADEKTLQAAGVPTDTPALLEFFRKRSPKDADRKVVEDLVKQLDARSLKLRTRARDELLLRGPVAIPFLKASLKAASLETLRLTEKLLATIEATAGPDRPAAAARLLAARDFKGPKEARAALDVLLDFLPFAGDEWLEEEILRSVGALAGRQRQLEVLAAALKDPRPERRAAAGYILAQRGSLDQRKRVRQLLEDPEPAVQTRVAAGLAGRRALPSARVNAAADETFLKGAGVGTSGEALVEFFKKRSLDEKAQKEINGLIRQLGARSWAAREKAQQKLLGRGTPALPFLRLAVENDEPETALRAARCIRQMKQGPGPELPMAAVRLLARAGEPSLPLPKPAGKLRFLPARALQALLAYAPFTDDDAVEDEVLGGLTLLGVRGARVDPLLLAALTDPLPPRRAAAAYVLGRVGTRAHCAAVRKLLDDPVLKVRLRAAQGLLCARDRSAVPALINLLDKAPNSWAGQVEDSLARVAGEKAPELPFGATPAETRAKAAAVWRTWWGKNEFGVDLARAAQEDQRLGLTLIVEYDANFRRGGGGKVWECGRDGKPRWKIENLAGPMDAQVLPNGRVLVAENNLSRVTERETATGNIVWQFSVANPVVCRRLPNGHTFIATYNSLVELNAAHKEVFRHNLAPNFFIFGASKMRNGHIACITSQGVLLEFDPAARKTVRTLNLGMQGNWCGVDALPNGRFLVALYNFGEVREIDATGKVHWKCSFPGVFRASRLPNGNVLAVSMSTRRVAELDRNGRPVWETTATGRPWQARAR